MSQNVPNLRAVLVWHRRCGKDLTCINVMAIKSQQRKGLYLYVGPFQNQLRKILWQGQDGEGRKFIDFIPRELVVRKSEQEMSLTLTNGSVIQLIGADDPDRAVGTNPVGIIFSEAALCNPEIWHRLSPVLAENEGWAIFNSTPRGKNWFYGLLNKGKADKNWFTSHLKVTETKAIRPENLRKAREDMSEAMFQQEFMSSFETPVEGSYFGDIITRLYKKKQILSRLPPDPSLPVHTAWDLGMDDATSIWFFQQLNNEVRILSYYENSGEGLPFYAQELAKYAALHDVSFGKHYFPHDVKVRELGTGHSRIETLRKLGIRATPVKRMGKSDQVEAVRGVLPKCWFSSGDCPLGIEHLKNYHKEWDEARQVFKKQPVHDKASHGADAFMTLAVGLKDKRQLSAEQDKKRFEYTTTAIEW
jgi:hypothetical protein